MFLIFGASRPLRNLIAVILTALVGCTLYSDFLAQVRSQPKVWRDVHVKNTQKELPQDVFESIKAVFSGADAKEDVFELPRQPMIDLVNKHKLR